ncbi:MAG: hypothetical protein ACPGUD_11535 [Parashewanella sp.]
MTPASADNYIRSYFINNTSISVCGIQANTKANLSAILKGSTSSDNRGCDIDGIEANLIFLMNLGIPSIGITTSQKSIPVSTETKPKSITITGRYSDFQLATQINGDEADYIVTLSPVSNFSLRSAYFQLNKG